LFDAPEQGRPREAGHGGIADAHDRLRDEVVVVDARGPEQPGGARFGELVHATLAVVPLSAERSTIDALAAVQGRILAAPADETAAAVDVVERVLAHDLLRRARAADALGACRRETPVTLALADGTFVEGVVDLAFEEAGAWTVVDYKTDREIAGSGEAQYRRQVGLYAFAIAHATGQPARGVLVRT
jgi:ATP-dependent exoDNAse (exonuclease V) beta subunit